MRALPVALASVALIVALIALVTSSRESPSSDSASSSSDPRLTERLESLEREIRALRADFAALELAAGSSKGAPPSAPLEARLVALEEAVAPVLAGGAKPSELAFEQAVTDAELDRTRRAIAAVRREELGEKLEGWIGKEQARSESVLQAIEDKLSLPARTMQRVRDLFAEETEAHGAILDDMWSREPPQTRAEEEAISADWDRATVQMKEIRRDRDAALEVLLGEEQFEELEAVVKAVERRPQPGGAGKQ